MVLLRVISVLGLTLASFVTGAYGDPLIEEFPRLYENFMSIFESLGGRRYLEAIQNGEEVSDVSMQQDYSALQNFFGTCLREIVKSDLGTLRPSIKTGYEKIQACTNVTAGCGATNVLKFTQAVNNAVDGDFRYGFDGPGNLQGTFWIRNLNVNVPNGAVLMNFAKSLDPFPLSPGAVLPADPAGVNIKIRVGGDRTFAFNTDGGLEDSAFDQVIRQDLIYEYAATAGFDNLDPAPPIQNANFYFIYPTFKVPGFPCVRIKFRPCLAFIYTMDMSVQPKSNSFPGSVIWNVNIRQFGATLASFQYIQIVDGTGTILPAYNNFTTQQNGNPVKGNIFFRSILPDQPLVPCGVGV